MENFFIDDNFFSELDDCVQYMGWDREEIESFPDDFKLEGELTTLEPLFQLDSNWITERINEERFSEDYCDDEIKKITKILDENIDYDKINSQIPKLHYGNRQKIYFTKADLLEVVD